MSKGLPLQQQRVNPLQNEDDTQDKEDRVIVLADTFFKIISVTGFPNPN